MLRITGLTSPSILSTGTFCSHLLTRLPVSMQTVYAAQFEFPATAFDEVTARTRDWIAGTYDASPDDIPNGEVWNPFGAHEVELDCRAVENDVLFEVDWRLPQVGERHNFVRHFEGAIARVDSQAHFDISVSVDYRTFAIAPAGGGVVRRPAIVDEIVKRCECYVGGTSIRWYPKTISADHMPKFLTQTLEDDSRALPIVFVSRLASNGQVVADPEAVQDRLLGLANVYELTEEASGVLSEEIGRSRSCYNGAVRLYWPGFSRRSISSNHPYYLAGTIERHAEGGQLIEDELFQRLARIAAERHKPSHLAETVRTRIADMERARLREQAEDVPNEWLDEFDALEEQVQQLREDNRSLRDQVEQLEEQAAHAREQFHLVREYSSTEGITPDQAQVQPEDLETVETIEEVLQLAETAYEDWIYVWKSARRSAKGLRYYDMEEVFEALKSIAQLAQHYDENDGDVGSWKDYFEQQSIAYSPHESESTMNQYGDQRQFSDGERWSTMQKHITMGQNRNLCLQIFFDRGEDDHRFQIGYCGEHLDYATKNT